MAQHIACGDVVQGCQFTAEAATEEELLLAVRAHAAADHARSLGTGSDGSESAFRLAAMTNEVTGKAPAEKYWLHMGQDRTSKVPDSEACQFKEHIFPFVRSQMVAMINFDSILHNPDFFDEKHVSVLNMVMPTPNREIDHTILQYHGKGVMSFQCDIHAHMNGYWAGFSHPYFAVTNADGMFQLSGVPPGRYTLVAWHEGYKIVSMDHMHPIYDRPHVIQKEIEVQPNGTVDVHFEFPVRKVTIE